MSKRRPPKKMPTSLGKNRGSRELSNAASSSSGSDSDEFTGPLYEWNKSDPRAFVPTEEMKKKVDVLTYSARIARASISGYSMGLYKVPDANEKNRARRNLKPKPLPLFYVSPAAAEFRRKLGVTNLIPGWYCIAEANSCFQVRVTPMLGESSRATCLGLDKDTEDDSDIICYLTVDGKACNTRGDLISVCTEYDCVYFGRIEEQKGRRVKTTQFKFRKLADVPQEELDGKLENWDNSEGWGTLKLTFTQATKGKEKVMDPNNYDKGKYRRRPAGEKFNKKGLSIGVGKGSELERDEKFATCMYNTSSKQKLPDQTVTINIRESWWLVNKRVLDGKCEAMTAELAKKGISATAQKKGHNNPHGHVRNESRRIKKKQAVDCIDVDTGEIFEAARLINPDEVVSIALDGLDEGPNPRTSRDDASSSGHSYRNHGNGSGQTEPIVSGVRKRELSPAHAGEIFSRDDDIPGFDMHDDNTAAHSHSDTKRMRSDPPPMTSLPQNGVDDHHGYTGPVTYEPRPGYVIHVVEEEQARLRALFDEYGVETTPEQILSVVDGINYVNDVPFFISGQEELYAAFQAEQAQALAEQAQAEGNYDQNYEQGYVGEDATGDAYNHAQQREHQAEATTQQAVPAEAQNTHAHEAAGQQDSAERQPQSVTSENGAEHAGEQSEETGTERRDTPAPVDHSDSVVNTEETEHQTKPSPAPAHSDAVGMGGDGTRVSDEAPINSSVHAIDHAQTTAPAQEVAPTAQQMAGDTEMADEITALNGDDPEMVAYAQAQVASRLQEGQQQHAAHDGDRAHESGGVRGNDAGELASVGEDVVRESVGADSQGNDVAGNELAGQARAAEESTSGEVVERSTVVQEAPGTEQPAQEENGDSAHTANEKQPDQHTVEDDGAHVGDASQQSDVDAGTEQGSAETGPADVTDQGDQATADTASGVTEDMRDVVNAEQAPGGVVDVETVRTVVDEVLVGEADPETGAVDTAVITTTTSTTTTEVHVGTVPQGSVMEEPESDEDDDSDDSMPEADRPDN